MSKSFFAVLAFIMIALVSGCGNITGGEPKSSLYTEKDVDQAIGYGSYSVLRCGKGLQTIDLAIGSSSNSLGLKASLKEKRDSAYDEFDQQFVRVEATLPSDYSLPLIIIHAHDHDGEALDDQPFEPNVSPGGALDMRLETDRYVEYNWDPAGINGVTFCVKPMKTS